MSAGKPFHLAAAEWLLCAISTALIGLCVGWVFALGWAVGLILGFRLTTPIRARAAYDRAAKERAP